MDKKSEQPGSYFRELRNNFLGKILKFCDADPGWEKFGSGMEKIRIRDPEFGINPGSATLQKRLKEHNAEKKLETETTRRRSRQGI